MLGRVWAALAGSSRRTQSADLPRRRPPTLQVQEFTPCVKESERVSGPVDFALEELFSSPTYNCESVYGFYNYPHTSIPATAPEFKGEAAPLQQEPLPFHSGQAILEYKRLIKDLGCAQQALQHSRLEVESLKHRQHQLLQDWEAERSHLRQRLEWYKARHTNDSLRLDRATDEAAGLQRALAESQQARTALGSELGLAQRDLQAWRLESRRWTTGTKEREELSAAKSELERTQRELRLLTAGAQELRGAQARLAEVERANIILTNRLCLFDQVVNSKNLLLQRAATLEVELSDARDLIAELKAELDQLRSSHNEDRQRKSARNTNRTTATEQNPQMPSPGIPDDNTLAPIYYTQAQGRTIGSCA